MTTERLIYSLEQNSALQQTSKLSPKKLSAFDNSPGHADALGQTHPT